MRKIKYLMKSYTCLAFCLFCLLAVAIVITYDDLFPANANFNLVDTITENAKIVCIAEDDYSIEYLYSLDVSECNKIFSKQLKIRNLPSGGYFSTLLAVTPDATKIFIGFTNTILKVDTVDYKIRKRWNPEQFSGNPKHALQAGFLIATNTTLWFSDRDLKKGYDTIYKCQIINPQKNCKKTKYVYERYNQARKLYLNKGFTDLTLFTPNPLLVPVFETENITPADLGSYQIIDYEKNMGWLYSSTFLPFKSHMKKICLLPDIQNAKPKLITEGSCARWGADGYIYYLKGSGDLWRIDPQQKIKELVFQVPAGSIEVKWALPPLIISSDRKFLAHEYGNKIVIFNLIKKEYRIIYNLSGSTCIAFVNTCPSQEVP